MMHDGFAEVIWLLNTKTALLNKTWEILKFSISIFSGLIMVEIVWKFYFNNVYRSFIKYERLSEKLWTKKKNCEEKQNNLV